jgi:hypothetical protein
VFGPEKGRLGQAGLRGIHAQRVPITPGQRLAKRCDRSKKPGPAHYAGGISGAKVNSIFDKLTLQLIHPEPINLTD